NDLCACACRRGGTRATPRSAQHAPSASSKPSTSVLDPRFRSRAIEAAMWAPPRVQDPTLEDEEPLRCREVPTWRAPAHLQLPETTTFSDRLIQPWSRDA